MRILLLLLLPITAFAQVVLAPSGTQSEGSSTWTFLELGATECGSITENSATSLTHSACGSSDLNDLEIAYQSEATATDVGIECTVGSPTGTTENFTGAGVGLRETQAVDPLDDYAVQMTVHEVDGQRYVSKIIENQSITSSQIGGTGIAYGNKVRVQYDTSESLIETSYSTDGGTTWLLTDSISKTLTFPVQAYNWATSHDIFQTVTYPLTNCVKDNTIKTMTTPGGSDPRQGIIWEVDLETGADQGRFSAGPDNFSICQVYYFPEDDISVTGITNADPAVITFTGQNPPLTDADNNAVGRGYEFKDVGGMTEINSASSGGTFQGTIRIFKGEMVNGTNVNSVGAGDPRRCNSCADNSYYLYVDNDPAGNANTQELGGYYLDTTGFGTYTTGGTGQAFDGRCGSSQDGNNTPDSGRFVRVEDGETYNGDVIAPRAGSYFLRSVLTYQYPYDHFGSFFDSGTTWTGNNGKNKPRFSMVTDEALLQNNFTDEYWTGFSIRLDDTHWTETLGPTDHRGRPFIYVTSSDSSETHWDIRLGRFPGESCSTFVLEYYWNDTGTSEQNRTEIKLGNVCDDLDDTGVWTDFIIHWRLSDGTPANGILQVWKASGTADGSGNRTMTRVFSRVGSSVGVRQSSNALQSYPFRYAYCWHHCDAAALTDRYIGYDEIRIGRAADGAGYQDVHPTQQACTDNCP